MLCPYFSRVNLGFSAENLCMVLMLSLVPTAGTTRTMLRRYIL